MGSKKQQTKEFARNILLYLIYHFQEEWKGIAADAEVQEFNKQTHNFLAAFQKLTGIQIDQKNPDWFCMKEPPSAKYHLISAAKGVVGFTPYLNAVSVLETCLSKLDQGKITLYQLTAENSNSGPKADSGFQCIGDGDAAAVKITEKEISGAGDEAHSQRPPLGEIAGWIYEKLKSLPEHKAMTIPEIADWLAQEKKTIVDETTIRTKHLPQLEPYGLCHKKRIGYYLR